MRIWSRVVVVAAAAGLLAGTAVSPAAWAYNGPNLHLTATTQDELAAAWSNPGLSILKVRLAPEVHLTLENHPANFTASIYVYGSTVIDSVTIPYVHVRDQVTVTTVGTHGQVLAYDSAQVRTVTDGWVDATGSAQVHTVAGGGVRAYGNAQVHTVTGGRVDAEGNAKVHTVSGGVIHAWSKAHVGTVTGGEVTAEGKAHVGTVTGGQITAWGKAQVHGVSGGVIRVWSDGVQVDVAVLADRQTHDPDSGDNQVYRATDHALLVTGNISGGRVPAGAVITGPGL